MSETAAKKTEQVIAFFLPDLGDIFFLIVLYVLIYLRPNFLLNDGSTGWHIVSGRYILQNLAVPRVDIMSYTKTGQPWIAYEWLCDACMAFLERLGGLNLLYVVTAITIASLAMLLYLKCRKTNCHFLVVAALVTLGLILSSIHWLVRPHIFTFFGVFIFLTYLDSYCSGAITVKKLLLVLSITMLVWANWHPAFFLGLAILAVYLFSSLFEFIVLKNENKQEKKTQIKDLSIALLLCFLASLCTPYGFSLYQYIIVYLITGSPIIAVTDEYLSPAFHGEFYSLLLEILFSITLFAVFLTRAKVRLSDIFIYLLFAHLTLSAKRNMPLYAIASLPILSLMFSNTTLNPGNGKLWLSLKPFLQKILDKLAEINIGFTANEKLYSRHTLPIIVSIILVLLALNGGRACGYPLLKYDFVPANHPNKNLALIKELNLDPKHGFSLDNWGGIIRYKIDYPVFIDDRADFYGMPFYFDYGKILITLPGWQDLMKKYQIKWVLLPKNNNLIQELKKDKDWQVKGEDSGSILMVENSSKS